MVGFGTSKWARRRQRMLTEEELDEEYLNWGRRLVASQEGLRALTSQSAWTDYVERVLFHQRGYLPDQHEVQFLRSFYPDHTEFIESLGLRIVFPRPGQVSFRSVFTQRFVAFQEVIQTAKEALAGIVRPLGRR